MARFFSQKPYATCVALETDVSFLPKEKKERERERERKRETERDRETERQRDRERGLYIALELWRKGSLRQRSDWEGAED